LPLDPVSKDKYKFTGEAVDPNTNLLFLRARYYDPSLGRFISRDKLPGSLELPRSRNAYQYSLSNPSTMWDRTGLSFVDATPAGGQVLAANTTSQDADTSSPQNLLWKFWAQYISKEVLPLVGRIIAEGPSQEVSPGLSAGLSPLIDAPLAAADVAPEVAQTQIQNNKTRSFDLQQMASEVVNGDYTFEQALNKYRMDRCFFGFFCNGAKLRQDLQDAVNACQASSSSCGN
jgi:RHS repeat-associated protein